MRRTQIILTSSFSLLLMAFAAAQQPPKTLKDAVDNCNKLESQHAQLQQEQSALGAEDARLQKEDSDLKSEVDRIRRTKMQFGMDANDLQTDINKYNGECGGMHTRSVYEQLRPKCEPWGQRIDKKTAELDKTAKDLTADQRNADQRQANLTRDTLNQTQKKKDNASKMADVETQLGHAQMLAIAFVVNDPMLVKKASESCKNSGSDEQVQCCNSVIWDKADPTRCGIPLIYQVLKKGGLFGVTEVVPVSRRQ